MGDRINEGRSRNVGTRLGNKSCSLVLLFCPHHSVQVLLARQKVPSRQSFTRGGSIRACAAIPSTQRRGKIEKILPFGTLGFRQVLSGNHVPAGPALRVHPVPQLPNCRSTQRNRLGLAALSSQKFRARSHPDDPDPAGKQSRVCTRTRIFILRRGDPCDVTYSD